MPFTVNDSGLYTGLARFLGVQRAAMGVGLQEGADLIEGELKATRAHGDQSGATRDGYTAYVVGPGVDGSAKAARGYAAAQAALAGFTGHAGKALSQTISFVLPAGGWAIIATTFTNYQDKLETENGGLRAALGPTMLAFAQAVTAFVASACKDAR